MLPVPARDPALGLADSFPFPFENGFQPGWRYAAFTVRSPTRGVSAALNLSSGHDRIQPDDQLTQSATPHILVPTLRKDNVSFHQGSLVPTIPDRTRVETSKNLLLRTTLLAPLVQPLHEIDRTPDFELDGLAIIGVPNLKGIDVPLDVELITRFFHLDAWSHLGVWIEIRRDVIWSQTENADTRNDETGKCVPAKSIHSGAWAPFLRA